MRGWHDSACVFVRQLMAMGRIHEKVERLAIEWLTDCKQIGNRDQ